MLQFARRLLFVGALLTSFHALADPPDAAAPSANGVLLSPLKSSADVRAQAAAFNTLLAQELGKLPDLKVATVESVGALSPDQQRQLKRGDSAASSLAAQAGSKFLIGGKLSTIGDLALLQLFLVDAPKGKIIARASLRQRGSIESLRTSIPSLVASLAAHLKPAAAPDKPPAVSQIVDYNQGFLHYCYEEQLRANPHLAGHVMLQFRLTSDRQIDELLIDDAASNLKSEPLFRCIEGSSRQWRIPHVPIADASKEGVVESPFNFTPVLGGVGPAAQAERRLLPRSSAVEGKLKSSSSKTKIAVRFENHTSAPVQLYWLDFLGKRKRFPDLPAESDRTMQTFLGHPWLAADQTGRALEIFVPASASTVAVIEGSLKPRDPAQESSLKSLNSKVPASIRFVNRTSAAVQLYWLDYQGKRTQRDQVAPLQEKSLPTYATHPWLVTDAKGKALAIYDPKDGGESLAIIEPSP